MGPLPAPSAFPADARRPLDGPLGAAAPERPDSARAPVEFGGALSHLNAPYKSAPVNPSGLADKARDKLRERLVHERRDGGQPRGRRPHLVDIKV